MFLTARVKFTLMSQFACPLCGKFVSLRLFDPSGFDRDIYAVEVRGLGRGRGTKVISRMKITKLNNGNGNGMSNELIVVPPVHLEVLTDAGDGLPEGLAEYPSLANRD